MEPFSTRVQPPEINRTLYLFSTTMFAPFLSLLIKGVTKVLQGVLLGTQPKSILCCSALIITLCAMSETITTDENDEEIVNAIIEILQLPSLYQRSN